MNATHFAKWLLAASFTSFCLVVTAQDRSDPEQLRTQARELMDKARDLKADGNVDESDKVARKAKELVRQADDLQQKRRDEQRDRTGDVERPRRSESESDRSLARPERREPREPAPARRPLSRRPLPEDRAYDRGGPLPDRLPPEFDRGGEFRDDGRFFRPGPWREEMAVRRYHIREAIRHLRAAGLDDAADRLEDRLHFAMRRFQEFRRESRRDLPPPERRPERPLDRDRQPDP
jgi:hypothetical protein